MEEKWYRLEDKPNIEASLEAEPQVRNTATGHVLRRNKRGYVSIFFGGVKINVRPERLLFCALHGIRYGDMPEDVTVSWDGAKFLVESKGDRASRLYERMHPTLDKDTQLRLLDETAAFVMEQATAVRTGNYAGLIAMLYGFTGKGVAMAAKYANIGGQRYQEMKEYAGTAVTNIVYKVRGGRIEFNHPVAAIKNELAKYERNLKRTVTNIDGKAYRCLQASKGDKSLG